MDPKIHFSEQALEIIAHKIIMTYDQSLINGTPRAIPIEDIIEKQYGLNIEYQYLRKNGRLLGEIVFDDGAAIIYDRRNKRYDLIMVKAGTVLIEGTLGEEKNDGRLRFTQAHELAHWLLHKKIYAGSGESAAYNEVADDSLEWQADYLSSAILMPLGPIKKCFYKVQTTEKSKTAIIAKMAEIFRVSKQAMKIRLESHNLIY